MIASVLKVLGGISIGVGIGTQWARVELDRYYRKKGEEFVSQQYRAMSEAFAKRQIEPEAPAEEEHHLILGDVNGLDGPDSSANAVYVGGQAILETPIADLHPTDYVALASEYAHPNMLDGISYITEDDYNEDDGNAKEQISIMLGGEAPSFIHDGIPISNWAELIGETILVDFHRLIPPGETERVLYVRNHRRGEDFEVFQVMP
jgi:hypothetical protein